MELVSLIIRSPTRLRLLFNAPVDSSAFSDSISIGEGTIEITSLDSGGVDPEIKSRLAVIGSPNSMELVLRDELSEGSAYVVALDSVPSSDSSTCSGAQNFRPGTKQATLMAVEPDAPDLEKLLYNTDLVWTGLDFLETPDGDLATVSGRANVKGALLRRLVSEGLLWNFNYGVKPREQVDGPTAATPFLRGLIMRQMLEDNRVSSVSVALVLPSDEVEEADYNIDIVLRGTSDDSNISIAMSDALAKS